MTLLFLYIVGGGLAVITTVALLIMQTLSSFAVFVVMYLCWVSVLMTADRLLLVQCGRRTVAPLVVGLSLALAGLLSVEGWQMMRYAIAFGGGLMIGILFIAALFRDSVMQPSQKMIRRVIMMYWVFVVYGILTTMFALSIFFQNGIPFWIVSVCGGAIAGYSAWMIWREYVELPFTRGLVWILLMGLITIEWMWMMYLLPFGYLVSGLLVVWPWYVIQLLIRFHFGRTGVLWERQRWFLATNTVLYILFIFFVVRWV